MITGPPSGGPLGDSVPDERLYDLDDLIEPEREVVDFETALDRLASGGDTIEASLLSVLSDPRAREVDLFGAAWAKMPDDQRVQLAGALFEAAEASFQVHFDPFFVLLLDDELPTVRTIAIDGLWENDEPRLARRYTGLLQRDTAPEVRARAAAALGDFIYRGELDEVDEPLVEETLAVLVESAADEGEDPLVRRRALESAGYADRPDIHDLIEGLYDDGNRQLRLGAIAAMGRSADEGWSRAVLDTLDESDPELQYEAAIAAGRLAIHDAVPLLMDFADESERELRLAAVWSLGEIGGRRARQALESLLDDAPDDDFAEAVEDALGMVSLSDGELPWGLLGE